MDPSREVASMLSEMSMSSSPPQREEAAGMLATMLQEGTESAAEDLLDMLEDKSQDTFEFFLSQLKQTEASDNVKAFMASLFTHAINPSEKTEERLHKAKVDVVSPGIISSTKDMIAKVAEVDENQMFMDIIYRIIASKNFDVNSLD